MVERQQLNGPKVLQNDGSYPLLPSEDVNNISLAGVRSMLKEYIELAWSMYQNLKSMSSELMSDRILIAISPIADSLIAKLGSTQ